MSEELQNKLEFWATQFPESFNDYDYERFYSFILQCYKEDYRISESTIAEVLKEKGGFPHDKSILIAKHYSDIYHHIFNFLRYIKYKE